MVRPISGGAVLWLAPVRRCWCCAEGVGTRAAFTPPEGRGCIAPRHTGPTLEVAAFFFLANRHLPLADVPHSITYRAGGRLCHPLVGIVPRRSGRVAALDGDPGGCFCGVLARWRPSAQTGERPAYDRAGGTCVASPYAEQRRSLRATPEIVRLSASSGGPFLPAHRRSPAAG